jgi:plasmid stabilization system protein ParE
MQKYRFHREALAEFEDSALYYEGERTGLGYEFTLDFERTRDLIIEFPEIGRTVHPAGVRQFAFRQFKHRILYSPAKDLIRILAVSHQHRDPDHWLDRLKDVPS